jgi:hypothetical protein
MEVMTEESCLNGRMKELAGGEKDVLEGIEVGG